MASTTEVDARVERDLAALFAELDDLPEVAAEWAVMEGPERASFSLDWDHLMIDYLGELRDFEHEELMTADQRARFADFWRRLHEVSELVRQLELYAPQEKLSRQNGGPRQNNDW